MRILRCLSGSLLFPYLLLICGFQHSAHAQGLLPAEAAGRMTPAEGFSVKLVASEPMVRQPVTMEFDSRGRLWVIQYLQYPNPEGLERVKVDRFSRTVYDRVPEPPPKGPRGADRITILEDTDSDGVADRATDFVSGLNLASGLALGHGGVFVLQAPYLLYYPDRNNDDAPDSDPEVLLSGFGLEDASAVANSLTFGPDGWLYGCQGSTVTANICGITFQQGVWRYHPLSKKFELFCDGGGNTWGLDFDEEGNLLYSTNYGGFVLLHGVQGGYYWKAFEKHGPLSNPFAYGYFDHAAHKGFRGGHVTVGGIVYQGDSFPDSFRGRYIAADLLGHAVYWHTIEPSGSTFRTAHAGELLLANDTWFAPTDVTTGPDGSIFVCDFHDQRTAHPDPDAVWDRSNGRIFKIEAAGTRPYDGRDLAELSSGELIGLLSQKNGWHVRTAQRLLGQRRDKAVIPALRRMIDDQRDHRLALQALWGLYVSGGFDDGLARKLLDHPFAAIRRWVIRLVGDEARLTRDVGARLTELAETEPDIRVRSQLASTARRLPAEQALPIIERLVRHDADSQDPFVPLLLWWAIEWHSVTARERVLALATSPGTVANSLVQGTIAPRLIRRFAVDGTDAGYAACGRLLAAAGNPEARRRMVVALDEGLRERSPPRGTTHAPPKLPADLRKQLTGLLDSIPPEPALLRLLIFLGDRPAQEQALQMAAGAGQPVETRLAILPVLGEVGSRDCIAPLLDLLNGPQPEAVELAALGALQRFDDEAIAEKLLKVYPNKNDRLRARIRDVLLARKAWALAFLGAVEGGQVPSKDVPVEQLRPLAAYEDEKLDALVRKHWGSVKGGTPEEKLAEIRRLNNDLRAGSGDRGRGHELFKKHCATCHRLFDEGEKIGPDLTHANRKDRDYLLVSLVDPSALIRKEYQPWIIETTDGRVLTGLVVDPTPTQITLITLAGGKNERTALPRSSIEAMKESSTSTMPENLFKDLKPDELRDLFEYLQTEAPSK